MKTQIDLQNPNRHKTRIFPTRGLLVAVIVQAAMLLAAALPVYANSITWGAATGISGDNDVSTHGSLVGAFNLGSQFVNSTVINGVNFVGLPVSGQSNVTSGNFNLNIATTFQSASITPVQAPYSSLSAAYREMLSTPAGDFTTPFTLTMSGLTIGLTYEFQWWSNSSNAGALNLTTATAGNAVALSENTTGVSGGLGQFVIGTFVADSASQQIIFGSDFESVLNGFQLRLLDGTAVPETGSTLSLLGGVLLGLAVLHRKTVGARKA